ncbi:MAG: OmpA family protein [Magnetococcales bacterium]|nr:OmpA family protein [Magnetococcales bacterium]
MRKNTVLALVGIVTLGLSLSGCSSLSPESGGWAVKGHEQWHPQMGKHQLSAMGTQCYFCDEVVLDSDGDGVLDNADKCPDTPKGVKVDVRGCALDTDGDGVPDYMDKCPGTPSGVMVDGNGCPLDSDGDGVPDYKDDCLGTPAGVMVDDNGCPLDSDGDGVPDYKDDCLGTPAGVQVDANGCPLDTDGDGVYDQNDQCPTTPMGASVNDIGCWVLQNVEFDTGKSVIKAQYYGELAEVAKIMGQNPNLNVEIQGHTDNRGSASYNKRLSGSRAQAVVDHLIGEGVSGNRLTAVGYGPDQPIADNNTEAGMAMNRRVELKPMQ